MNEYSLILPNVRFSLKSPPNPPLIKGQVANHLSGSSSSIMLLRPFAYHLAISMLYGPLLADGLVELKEEVPGPICVAC